MSIAALARELKLSLLEEEENNLLKACELTEAEDEETLDALFDSIEEEARVKSDTPPTPSGRTYASEDIENCAGLFLLSELVAKGQMQAFKLNAAELNFIIKSRKKAKK